MGNDYNNKRQTIFGYATTTPWGWVLTTTLSISTLSKVSFSNLLTNDFLDHPKTSEDFFYFYTFDFYTFKNYTFESVVVSKVGSVTFIKVIVTVTVTSWVKGNRYVTNYFLGKSNCYN